MLSGPSDISDIYFSKNYNLWAWHIAPSQLLLYMYLNAKEFELALTKEDSIRSHFYRWGI